MLPLYHDPHFTFFFADDRIISRFHLEGIEAGRRVSVFKIDAESGERLAFAGDSDRGRRRLGGPVGADHRAGGGCVRGRAGAEFRRRAEFLRVGA